MVHVELMHLIVRKESRHDSFRRLFIDLFRIVQNSQRYPLSHI